MTINPLAGFHVDAADIEYIGQNLQRPESILAERDGTLWSADARGGVVRIAPDGTQTFITDTKRAMFSDADDDETRLRGARYSARPTSARNSRAASPSIPSAICGAR